MELLGKGMTFKVLDYSARLLPHKASGNWYFHEENMAVLIRLNTSHCWWWEMRERTIHITRPVPRFPTCTSAAACPPLESLCPWSPSTVL